MAANDPWAAFNPQPAPAAGPLPSPPQDPMKVSSDNRDNERLNLERERVQLEREKAARDAQGETQKRAKFDNSRVSAIQQVRRVLDKIDEIGKGVYTDGGWFETGKTGAMVRSLPTWLSAGSDAYNLEQNVKTLDANAAVAALNEMRQNSPTGGAVGQVSEGEYPMLAATQTGANLDPNMEHHAFLTNLAQAKNAWLQQLARLDPDAAHSYLGKEGIWANPRRNSFYYGALPGAPKTQTKPASSDGWTVERRGK